MEVMVVMVVIMAMVVMMFDDSDCSSGDDGHNLSGLRLIDVMTICLLSIVSNVGHKTILPSYGPDADLACKQTPSCLQQRRLPRHDLHTILSDQGNVDGNMPVSGVQGQTISSKF